MDRWGDDRVEWGKLRLGEGCCEDIEQEILIRYRGFAVYMPVRLDYDENGYWRRFKLVALAWTWSRRKRRREARPCTDIDLMGRAAERLHLSASLATKERKRVLQLEAPTVDFNKAVVRRCRLIAKHK